MIITRSIDIRAPLEQVYALMRDPVRRARLNPAITPLRVEIEGDGPLAVGTVCHFRLETATAIVDYRSHVIVLEPNRRVVWRTDTATPVTITLTVEPLPAQCRFTHSEEFDPTEAMLDSAAPSGSRGRFLQWVSSLLPFVDHDAAERLAIEREQRLKAKLEEGLARWLENIRAELEQQR